MKIEIEAQRNNTEEDYRLVVDYFMEYYNELQSHSSLGYVSPYKASGTSARNVTNFLFFVETLVAECPRLYLGEV